MVSMWSWILTLQVAELHSQRLPNNSMKQPHTLSVWPLSLKNRELQRIRRPLRKGNGTIEVQPATVAQSWSQLSSRLQPKSAYKNHVQIQPVQQIVLSTIDLAKQRKKLRVA